ncbi:MAG: sulfite exporter TauE/SafE family protein [Paludibacter sp.]
MEQIGFLLLGIAAGILSGLFGIGGGIIMVPTLIAFFGMDILNANATSLTAMLLPVGVFGVIAYYKAGLINIKDSLWIAFGLFVGSFIGGEFAVNVSENLLAKLYSGFLLYIALSYFDVFAKIGEIRRKYFSKESSIHSNSTSVVKDKSFPKPFWTFILVGFAAGIFAGMFGKGGGIIIVPILISLFHYDGKMAVATSLAALQLPVGLPSVLIYAQNGYLNIATAAIIAIGMVVGALIGSKMGIKLPAKAFKKYYAVFLLMVAIYMLVGYL